MFLNHALHENKTLYKKTYANRYNFILYKKRTC